jgi:hypothetical protein
MFRILFGCVRPHALVVHRARFGIKRFQVILHGFIENFAEGDSVVFLNVPNLQLRPRTCGAHAREFYHEPVGQPLLAVRGCSSGNTPISKKKPASKTAATVL